MSVLLLSFGSRPKRIGSDGHLDKIDAEIARTKQPKPKRSRWRRKNRDWRNRY